MRDLIKHRSNTSSSSSSSSSIPTTTSSSIPTTTSSSIPTTTSSTTATVVTGGAVIPIHQQQQVLQSASSSLLHNSHHSNGSNHNNSNSGSIKMMMTIKQQQQQKTVSLLHRNISMIIPLLLILCMIVLSITFYNQMLFVYEYNNESYKSSLTIQDSSTTTASNTASLSSRQITTTTTISNVVDSTTTTSNSNSNNIWPPMDMIEAIFQEQDEKGGKSQQQRHRRRLILLASNYQYIDFVQNIVTSLQQHSIYNYVIIPLDTKAYQSLSTIYPKHTVPVLPELVLLTDEDSSSTTTTDTSTNDGASFRSKAFEILTSSRPIFLEYFLLQNITIFYNDIDMIWQSNAFDIIDTQLIYKKTKNNSKNTIRGNTNQYDETNEEYDVLLWKDGPTQICTCLIYMKPTITSFNVLQEWKREIQTHLHPNDQKAFLIMAQKQHLIPSKLYNNNNKKNKNTKNKLLNKQQIHIFPNDEYFPTGAMYDWDTKYQTTTITTTTNNNNNNNNDNVVLSWKSSIPSIAYQQKKTNPNDAIIIHNNWIEGKVAKLQRFIDTQLWYV